jgi:hypothetical protein
MYLSTFTELDYHIIIYHRDVLQQHVECTQDQLFWPQTLWQVTGPPQASTAP